MTDTPTVDTDNEESVDPDDVMYLAFSSVPAHTVVRGPYTNEEAAVESIADDFDTFHIEPRIPQSDGSKSCVAENIHPTY